LWLIEHYIEKRARKLFGECGLPRLLGSGAEDPAHRAPKSVVTADMQLYGASLAVAIFTAIRRASSLVSSFAADR
jgi:hypothetical protein